ncbi:MAG: aspartate carbamoyltransferase catalytic subunit [Clostridia bacterium]|nr:aspartate carbamoyltransferase catalytic subunit [Clostridia bacterium]
MGLHRKDLLGLEELDIGEINLILDTADAMKEILGRDLKKVPTLRGKSVLCLFYEPSTRTRTSFEMAGKYLSADTSSIATSTSSIVKGESLVDTGRTIEAMGIDMVIIRHNSAGAPHKLARELSSSVINAGDGQHEHPTQGLLDMFTIREEKGRIKGLEISIIGDILYSRVARSNIWGLRKMGANIRIFGPPSLIPPYIDELGVYVCDSMEEAIEGADVINILRIQKERQVRGYFPSLREYANLYGMNGDRLRTAKEDVLVLHPGPMNRGIEITSEVVESSNALIEEQVTNGVAVRMALMYLLLRGGKISESVKSFN